MKADGALTINGGTFTVDSADDCLHSGGALAVTGGTFTLSSGDDAIHSDDAVTIRAGEFSIPYCYEGRRGACPSRWRAGPLMSPPMTTVSMPLAARTARLRRQGRAVRRQ